MTTQTISLLILTAVLSAIVVFFQYFRSKENAPVRNKLIYAILRFISVATILLLIFNPKFRKKNNYIEKASLIVAVDNSSSVPFLGQDGSSTDFIEKIRSSNSINDRFDLEFVTFGNSLKTNSNFDYGEGQTKINEALSSLGKVYKTKKAPVLLISDGNQTYGENYAYSSVNYPQEVFPVVLGDTVEKTDLKISQLNVNKYAFLKNEFPVELILNYNGDNAIETNFQIKKGNRVLFNQRLQFSPSKKSEIISTTLSADAEGTQLYAAVLQPLANEQNTINNTKEFAVEVIDQKTNILIISDIVHPDLGALKKSIESNERRKVDIEKTSIDVQKINDYQLVILYQPNSRFRNFFTELERSKANNLIITGTKTDWNFLNNIQQNFRKEYSRQREDVQAELNTAYSNFALNDPGFREYPPLEDFLGDIRFNIPFETILNQTIRNIETGNPLLFTTEEDGKRQAVLLGENIWRWRAQNYLDTKTFRDFDEFFGKLIFYLATNKKRNRLDVNFESFYNGNTEIRISAQYFDKNYEFDPNANVFIDLKNTSDNNSRTVPMLLKNNYYEVDLSGLPPGDYDFTLRVQNEQLSRAGSFRVLDFDIEKQFLNADLDKLSKLAENSGGLLFFPDQFDTLEQELLSRDSFKPVQKNKEEIVPLIDWKYLLLLIMLSLTAEWFLRKYNGLI
ncbi:VWA domain-containing protein [Leptobacterium flavescens]|uniref:VWA domain-containing protein n=1 Tax=Leptobacterium flavescens TaxID=472055 RepID=A0A6P0UKK3_9FLAO|nr:VWA domain-containing protein [Leptobacterium flavescens]NER13754.1 VWA domain-containing protein [Leptobacterium flavescens]